MTVLQLISDALEELGVIGPGDPLEDDDATIALRYFQMMVNTFQADRLMAYTVGRALFPLAVGQQTRTIGTGGNFNGDRPVVVLHVGAIPVGQTYEIPVVPYVNREEWLKEPWKAQTDQYPSRYLYEPTYPLGTFTFWPVPTTAAQVAIAVPAALTTPVALLTDLAFPPGYYEAYHTNAVKRLAKPFKAILTPDQKDAAREAIGVVKRLNDEGAPPAKLDAALVGGGGWDIQSGRSR